MYHQLTGPKGLETLTPEALAVVVEPFRTAEAQQALAAAGTQLSPAGLADIGRRIPEADHADPPRHGALDPALPVVAELARLQAELPHAVVTALDDCGTLLADFFTRPGG